MKTILFIEDEAALQKAFSDVFEGEGYSILSALNGEDGFMLAKSKKPDIILLDLILPKLHGFAVLEKLKKEKETQDIPVIILTNLESLEEVDRALELGAVSYFVKSHYGLEEIVEKVKKALSEK
jgi:DNA-binding response OmpR family regulator